MVCVYLKPRHKWEKKTCKGKKWKKSQPVLSERTRACACLRHRIYCVKHGYRNCVKSTTTTWKRSTRQTNKRIEYERHACIYVYANQHQYTHTHTQSHSHTERASTHSLTERETERMRARIFELNGPNSFVSTYRVGIATATAEFEPNSSIRKIFYLSIRRMCASHGQGNQTHHPTNESKHTL